jgi:hypothetical protein
VAYAWRGWQGKYIPLLWTMARACLIGKTAVFAEHDCSVPKRKFSFLDIRNPGTRALDRTDLTTGTGNTPHSRHFAGGFGEALSDVLL